VAFSSRSAFDLAPNALARALAAARGRGERVLDLTASNPTTAEIAYPGDAILRALADPRALAYEPLPFGLPSARAAVAERAGVDPSRVVLTASTSEAYGFLFKLLCDPGDDLLAPRPSYPLFDHLAALEGVRLAPYRLAYDGAWHVDLDDLARAVTPRTRGLLTVAPNNPTGSYLKTWELERMARTGLPIVSDEVFASYPLVDDPSRATTALEARDALVFALGGLSKLAALPQIKAAWIVVGGPDALARPALDRLELIADSFLSVSTPAQHALPSLLETSGAARGAIHARARANLAAIRRLAASSAATVLHVEGGWYATLGLPRVDPEEAWILTFLEEDGVHVHPASFFDFEDEAYAIVSLLTPEATFAEGIRRILARVAARVAA